MFFPKWHLSIKDLIWSFSLSVLLLEEQAQPTLKPTLGLFLGDPHSPCPVHHPEGWTPPHQAVQAQGLWGSQ